MTIHSDDEEEARQAAERAGVEFRAAVPAAPGLVRAEIRGDRDRSMSRLREEHNVVHHVYRDRQSPDNEFLITESFSIKFKPETPEHRIHQFFDRATPFL